MANMGYCRFENTLGDLRDCYEAMEDMDLSETEEKAKKRLMKLCQKIVADYCDDGNDD